MTTGQQTGQMKRCLLPIYFALSTRADFYTAMSHSVVSFENSLLYTADILLTTLNRWCGSNCCISTFDTVPLVTLCVNFYNVFLGDDPLPSNRHHRSNDDCLEGKRENYQVCSVQYCAQQLCTVQCTHMNRPNSSLDWVLSHWVHFTVLRFIFVYVLLHACVRL